MYKRFIVGCGFSMAMLLGSPAHALIVEFNGDPVDFRTIDFANVPLPEGTVLESVDRVFEFTMRSPFGGPNGEEVFYPSSFTVHETVIREPSGTLSFAYEYDYDVRPNIPGTTGDVEFNFMRNYGYRDAGLDSVNYELLKRPNREEPEGPDPFDPAVLWSEDLLGDDAIRTETGLDDFFRSYVIRTDATEYDATGTLSVDYFVFIPGLDLRDNSGTVTSPTFSPSSVTAVPLPPAVIPAMATMLASAGFAVLSRRRRAWSC